MEARERRQDACGEVYMGDAHARLPALMGAGLVLGEHLASMSRTAHHDRVRANSTCV